GVWLGNDDNTPTRKATGGGLPVEVWTRFMRVAHQGVPVAMLPNAQGSGLPTLAQIASQITAPPAPVQAVPGRPAAPRGPVRPEPSAGFDACLMHRLFAGRR